MTDEQKKTVHEVFRLGDATVMRVHTALNPDQLGGLLQMLARHRIGASFDGAVLTVYMPLGSTFVTRPQNLRTIAGKGGAS